MSSSRWLRSSLRRIFDRPHTRKSRSPSGVRLALECLEDRVTPSVTVTTTLDPTTPISGQLSLREAINMVNAGQVADNTIILPTGTYQNAQGALNVTHSLTLQGAGDTSSILDGGGTDRVILIDPAAAVNVQISGVTIRNGSTTGNGGGIEVQDVQGQSSTLTLMNSIITGNSASSPNNANNFGGGIYVNNGDVNVVNSQVTENQVVGMDGGGFGGGIAEGNHGTGNVTVTNSLIADNTAGGLGGGIALMNAGAGTLTVTGSTIRDNTLTAANAGGGGVFVSSQGNVNISNTTIQGNSALRDGGGFDEEFAGQAKILFNNDTILDNQATQGRGGGIAVASLIGVTIQNSTISDNSAAQSGGGVFATGANFTLTNTVLDSNLAGASGGGIEDKAVTLMATNSTISNNLARNGDGGGIDDLVSVVGNQTLTLTNDALLGNGASGSMGFGFGGGLYDATTGSTVTIASSLFANNSATQAGGGIEQAEGTLTLRTSQFTGNVTAVTGGALDFNAGGSLTVSDSTFNNNQAGLGGGALDFNSGNGNSSLTNDTFVGNTTAGDGGAIAIANGTLALVNDTINSNIAGGNGGGVSDESLGTHSFQNTILAGNTAGKAGPDVFTGPGISVTDNGGNFIGVLSGSSGFGAGTLTGNPMLGSLQNNGGVLAGASGDQQIVQSEALLPGSPALGKGMATGAPTTDERGFPRQTPPDIGAFQFQNVPLAVAVTPATPSIPVNGTETFTITVRNTGGNALPADSSALTVALSPGLTATSPLTFPLAAIPAGQNQTFTVTATANALGTQMLTASVTSVDANPNTVTTSATISVVLPPPPPPPTTMPTTTNATTTHSPVGPLDLFAFGLGPTGIELFEVDSIGDIFAVPLSGGYPIFLSATLQLPLAVIQDGRLLALLAGNNGQESLIDIFNPFNPLIEPALLAALMHG